MAGFGIGGNADFGRIAQEEGVPANLLPLAESIYQQETHSGQNVATSPRGAVGPMQVTPATFQDYHPNGDIHNPADNIRAGLRKIKSDSEFFNGDPSLTAAAYHAGRQAVVNAGNAVPDTNDGSISTADYADAVTQRLPTQPQPLPEPAKPPTWDEVRNDPRLKDAAPEVIEGARKQYFNRLILPKLQPDEIDGAWKRFDELTNPSMTASAKRTIGNAMDATTGAVSSAAKATYGAAGDAAKGVGMAITDAAKKVGGGNAVQARENPVTPEDVSIDEGGYHAPADMTARTEVKIPGSVMTVPTIEVAPHVDQRAMDAGLGPIDTDAMNLRVRRTLEAATPEEREAFAQRPDYIGQLAKDQLASWQKHDVQAAQLPALQGMTERWEDRAAQLQKQGMSKVDAEREAKAQATLAIPPHSEGSITPSDLDFEGQKGAKRVWNDWQSGMVGTTGGILSYVARKSGMGSAEDIGDAMSHWAEKKMPAEPTFSDKMVSNIAGMTNFYLGGVGVRTGTEALSMLGPVLAKWAGAAGDAGLMAASSANEVYHGALGQGLSEKEAAARADKAFAANALLFTGANRLGFFNDLTKLGEKVTAAAATNAPLMATQQVIQNYFLDRPLDEGVGEAALMGATAGAAVVGAHHLAGKLPVPAEKPAPVHIEPGLATEPAVGGKAEPAMGNVEVAASNEPAMGATPEVKGAKEPVLGAEPTLTESTKTPAIAKYEPVAGEPPPWEIPRKAFYADKQRPITTPMPLYATADPHKFLVEQALESGEPVPKDVLADYPALAAKYPQKEEPVATEPKKQSSETPETPEIVKPEPVTASRLEALAQAGKLSRSTGTPHEVIQNPNEPGKWLVQPKEEARTEEAPQSQLVKEYAQLKQREAAAKSLAEVGLPVTKQNTADHDAVKSAAAVDESKVDQLGIQYPTDEVAFMAGIRGIIDGNAGTETHKGGETIAGAGAKSGALRGREVSPLPAGKAEESGAVQTDRKNPNESLRTGDAKAEAGTAGATTGEVKPKSKLAQEYEAAKAKDRPAIVTQTPAQAGVSTPAGREVERFAGMYNKGLTAFNAKRVVKERSAEKPGLDWRAEPAPEHGPDRFVVVGREKPTPVDEAAREAATSPTNALPEPTEAQKKAGNYAKGHVNIGGLNISIENPEGSTRSGTDKNGKPWSVELKGAHYGYIRRTEGGDGEQVDAYVKAGTPEDYNGPVFVIDQKKPGNGHFDEHKAMIGYSDEAAARAGYQENYDKNWDGIRAITPMSFDEFKTWLKEGDTTRPANEAGDAKQAPAFSRNRGVPVEDLNAIVQGIRARWKGAPRIHPLFEHDEAPQSLQDEIAKSGGPRDHAGAFHNGEIYLFGKYMADDAHGQRVAVHELTHYGLEGLLGDDLGPVMMRIWKDHPGVQLEASRLMNRYHYSRVTAVNEVLANMGGKGERPSWWQKLTAAVRDSLRRYGFNLKMNDADVTSLVDRALQYSRKPKSDVTHLYRTHYSQPNPVWYSQMGRQIADKGSTAIPAEWRMRLESWANKGDIKRDELEWSGVKDWLALQNGKVSKEQVLDYLRNNGVKVEEVELADDSRAKLEAAENALTIHLVENEHFTNLGAREYALDAARGNLSSGQLQTQSAATRELAGELERLYELRESGPQAQTKDQTKFHQWQLPGGENYRELLLTLPVRPRDANPDIARKRDRFQQLVDLEEGRRAQRRDLTAAEVAERDQLANELNAAGPNPYLKDKDPVNFQSPHFDTPNILAHVRFNERTDAQGKRVLFIEELQSDWAQKGKRAGFAGDFESALTPEERELRDFNARTYRGAEQALSDAELARAADLQKRVGVALIEKHNRLNRGVPSAPFVGKTDAWVSLALKRMIRYAAENGFDRVAWTTGDQQAARYDLSKQVSTLKYFKEPSGNFTIAAVTPDGNSHRIGDEIPIAKLEYYVGKEVAKKIIEGKGDAVGDKGLMRLDGDLLKVGGEGMKAFYDKIIPNVANDVLKKLGGGKVGEVNIGAEENEGAGARGTGMQPGFDITPALREHAMEGVPLFARKDDDLLKTHTPAELKAREEAAKKAEAEKAKEPPGKKVTADQVDLFNPQGSLFSRAETPDEKLAKEYARAKAAEPTEPMPRGKLAREYTLTKDAHKAGALFSRADALGEVEAQSKDNWLKAHYLKAAKSVINFTDRLANPLVDLPGERDYLKHRQVAMGVIGSGNDVVKEIRNVFHEATPEDRQAAFDYFTTEGASPASIKDEKVRSGVQTIKDAINHVSDQLVDKGVINAESREEFRDRYLPQLYLRHLLEDNAWKIGGSGKKTSDMGYTKGRKLEQFRNAEGEVRLRDKATGKELSDQEVLKLGPVTDPEYLASVALARPMRDMAILDWLESISKDERWVLPNTTMKWNGKNVSPYFLKTEADRLRRQANYYEPEAGKRATGYADKMDAAANKALENLPTDSKGFTQIPNSGRYGAMRGIWVRSEVYHDLVGNAHFQPNDMNWFQNLFGVGGVGTKVTQMWKGTKTYLNPSGQVRNFVTNMTQLQLSGVPFHSLPSLMIKTIGEMRNKGPHFQEFKAQGGETGTFANEDLGRMQRELLDMQHRDGELSTWGQLHRAAAIVTNKAGDVWQANEVLGKLMKFIHERERGASPGNAMIEANKTLFDYSLVQPWIRYARSVPYGIPFATWNAKVLPRLTETALLHPQRYLPYVAAFYGAQYALASVLGVTYDDLDKLRKAMPQWLWDHHNAMLMPWKDAKGRWQVMDLSYFMPWQQWGQLANDTVHGDVSKSLQDIGAFGGPIPNIISAISTQQDPFTHRDIAHKGDPPMQQAASWLNYAWTLAAPPFLTDSGALGHAIRAYTGTTNKYGDPLDTPTQSLLRPFGINLYALTPEQTQMANVQRMKHDVNDSERELKTQLLDRSLSPEQRDTIRNRYLDEIQRREGKINQYLEDSKIAPALRTGH